MARIKLNDEVENVLSLDELIPKYAENKNELDSYKKLCDEENAQIKQQMLDLGQDKYSAGGYTATRTVSTRESMNEDKLLAILFKHKINEAIKTKEYVDMDALENYLYHNEINAELAADLESCKQVTEVVTLRVKAEKKKKEDDE